MRDDGIWLAQAQVRAFHEKFGCTVGTTPEMRDYRLRRALIMEEGNETVEALWRNDLPGIAKELCDLLYVALGTAVACGIDLQPVWDRVHASNMAKEGGATREDGKILKPAGWVPPDVEGALVEQGWIKP